MGNVVGKGSLHAVIGVIANKTHFTREEVEALHKDFWSLTKNGECFLDKEGFKQLCEKHNLGSRAELLFPIFDKSKTGKICFKDFVFGFDKLPLQKQYSLHDLHSDSDVGVAAA
mmetsp:Transcript_36596/g.44282  ORF Transcript_36596/g.44282 Transcript_36596/m.44282 type:complete len:114 (-) Transcript_36596:470-811(-)|eukprot:CAMPEP_0197847186 /NCGR_PEP_ID=MMETSP1438-20131217/5433_1 /TAXON_ID=1461541 /ORGANISM="Pterosperma sp., Strain CCMP1384" /LENGTH=113 /DNA_ID=CAMNT_0043459037 /DNA_START=125 /DNA_END=466 /DNA_ORIENTATION=+